MNFLNAEEAFEKSFHASNITNDDINSALRNIMTGINGQCSFGDYMYAVPFNELSYQTLTDELLIQLIDGVTKRLQQYGYDITIDEDQKAIIIYWDNARPKNAPDHPLFPQVNKSDDDKKNKSKKKKQSTTIKPTTPKKKISHPIKKKKK
jgi:hypothetical protein